MAVRRGIFVAPFDELVDPRVLARLATATEAAGFDGFFVWDHIVYSAPARAVADPWIALAAVAGATERVRIGPLVTPLARRRIHKLARETVTLDLMSNGRLTLGVGLGGDRHGEFERFGEETDPRERARLLDSGLEDLVRYWSDDFEPPPVQQPRIPIWVAGRYPNRRPVRRAARWDGLFPIDLPGPDALRELVDATGRSGDAAFDVVVTNPPGEDVAAWEAAGATWCLTGFSSTPSLGEVTSAIAAGP